jgi:hypothetical protein
MLIPSSLDEGGWESGCIKQIRGVAAFLTAESGRHDRRRLQFEIISVLNALE